MLDLQGEISASLQTQKNADSHQTDILRNLSVAPVYFTVSSIMLTRLKTGKIQHYEQMYVEPTVPAMDHKSKMTGNQLQCKYLVLDEGMPTFFNMNKKLISNIAMRQGAEFIPMKIRGFEVQITNNKPTKFVRLDIKTATGLKNDILIQTENLYAEDYYDGIVGNEDILLQMKFITISELKKSEIDDVSAIYSYK